MLTLPEQMLLNEYGNIGPEDKSYEDEMLNVQAFSNRRFKRSSCTWSINYV